MHARALAAQRLAVASARYSCSAIAGLLSIQGGIMAASKASPGADEVHAPDIARATPAGWPKQHTAQLHGRA